MNAQQRKQAPRDNQEHLAVDEQHQTCLGSSADPESACLCPEKDYLIKEEDDALAELRRIKNQATLAKKRCANLQKEINSELLEKNEASLNPEERGNYAQQKKLHAELKECEESIEALRSQWKDWDNKRKQATRKKMILLGHIS